MKRQSTYFELEQRLSEIKMFQHANPTIASFLDGKIQKFISDHKYHIDDIQTETRRMWEDYVERNEAEDVATKGIYKMSKQIVDGGHEFPVPVFKDDAAGKAFMEAHNRLMKKTCTIIL